MKLPFSWRKEGHHLCNYFPLECACERAWEAWARNKSVRGHFFHSPQEGVDSHVYLLVDAENRHQHCLESCIINMYHCIDTIQVQQQHTASPCIHWHHVPAHCSDHFDACCNLQVVTWHSSDLIVAMSISHHPTRLFRTLSVSCCAFSFPYCGSLHGQEMLSYVLHSLCRRRVERSNIKQKKKAFTTSTM